MKYVIFDCISKEYFVETLGVMAVFFDPNIKEAYLFDSKREAETYMLELLTVCVDLEELEVQEVV